MLRLRPSELTLTPELVDEAFRCIVHRQTLPGPVSSQSPSHHGRPVLRRGPQRNVQTAMTSLGDIPILRPQAHRAIRSSHHDGVDDESQLTTPSPKVRADSVSPDHQKHSSPARLGSPVSTCSRRVHLPLRLGRSHRLSPTQTSAAVQPADRHLTPPNTPPQAAARPNNSVLTGSSPRTPPTLAASPSTHAELRGGGRTGASREPNTTRDDASTLSDNDDGDHPQRNLGDGSTSTQGQQTRYLCSHLMDARPGADRPEFEIRELRPRGSQTEPRHPSRRMWTVTRSLSSGNASSYDSRVEGHRSSLRATYDYPAPTALSRPPPGTGSSYSSPYDQQPFSSRLTSRPIRSEASAASGAYSLYELPPGSRDGSGDYSNPGLHAQYDGSMTSRPFVGGTYQSVRPPSGQPFSAAVRSPVYTTSGGQYGVSPLPSFPYDRQYGYSGPVAFSGRNPSTPPSSSPGYLMPASFPVWTGPPPTPSEFRRQPPRPGFTPAHHHLEAVVPRHPADYNDAATAALSARPSPLETFAEYYQQTREPHISRRSPPASSLPRYPIDQYSAAARNNGRSNHAGPQLAQDPFAQYPPGTIGRLPPHLMSHAEHVHRETQRQTQRNAGRDPHTARSEHRSSENAPVPPPVRSSAPSQYSQVQRHRQAFEAMHNLFPSEPPRPDQTRYSVPHPTAPRDASNQFGAQQYSRPNSSSMQVTGQSPHMPSSPAPPNYRSPSGQLDPTAPSYRPRSSPRSPPSDFPYQGPGMRGGGIPDGTWTRARRRVTPAQMQPRDHLRAPRASLPLQHAASLRSPLLRASTLGHPLRRVPAQQRDQENSGAGEEELMRREAAAIQARYGEEGQGHVMDETPPKVGRVERRMFS
ncbi:hypothetical protein ACEQ8H_003573 [Pleosporales sp. CAS-2024a]